MHTQFSHIRTIGQSDRKSFRHPIHNHHHQSRTRVVLSKLHTCIIASFPPRSKRTPVHRLYHNSMSLVSANFLAPRKAEPPLTPFGSNPGLPTVRSRRKGPPTEVFGTSQCPSNGHVTITSPETPLTPFGSNPGLLTVSSRRKRTLNGGFWDGPTPVLLSCHDHVAYSHNSGSLYASTRASLYNFCWTTRCDGFFNNKKARSVILYGV